MPSSGRPTRSRVNRLTFVATRIMSLNSFVSAPSTYRQWPLQCTTSRGRQTQRAGIIRNSTVWSTQICVDFTGMIDGDAQSQSTALDRGQTEEQDAIHSHLHNRPICLWQESAWRSQYH